MDKFNKNWETVNEDFSGKLSKLILFREDIRKFRNK